MFFFGPIPIVGSKKKSNINISTDILCAFHSTVPVKSLDIY